MAVNKQQHELIIMSTSKYASKHNPKPSNPTPEPVRPERASDVVKPVSDSENPPQAKTETPREIGTSGGEVTRYGDFGIRIEKVVK
jgi:hypothetical protein